MTGFLIVLLLFLLAFLGMAAGVIMGRRRLRVGCGGGRQKSDCKESKCHCSGMESNNEH